MALGKIVIIDKRMTHVLQVTPFVEFLIMQIAHLCIFPKIILTAIEHEIENIVLIEKKLLEVVRKHLFEKVNLPGSRQKVYKSIIKMAPWLG
jgi:hypothetical protein